MKIIADVMGGDRAPLEMIKGAADAAEVVNAEIVIVGREDVIRKLASENSVSIEKLTIVNADDVVSMEDDPLSAVRKKPESSMIKGLNMLSCGEGDAFVSCGNTGALFTGAYLLVKKIKGISRPAIGTVLPLEKPVLLLDCGANVECKEEYLEQFARMGKIYMQNVYGMGNPRVGLLNNGTEDCKGPSLYVETHKRLAEAEDIKFVGNVEPTGLNADKCDVLVADGFTGNILLKTFESVGSLMLGELKGVFYSNVKTKLSALLVKKQLSAMKKKYDSEEIGGSPILGIRKPVIKAHGSSKAKAFKNAIIRAAQFAGSGVVENIESEMQENRSKGKESQNA